jgi:hypothetical protein
MARRTGRFPQLAHHGSGLIPDVDLLVLGRQEHPISV